jgi:hypothetical protein
MSLNSPEKSQNCPTLPIELSEVHHWNARLRLSRKGRGFFAGISLQAEIPFPVFKDGFSLRSALEKWPPASGESILAFAISKTPSTTLQRAMPPPPAASKPPRCRTHIRALDALPSREIAGNWMKTSNTVLRPKSIVRYSSGVMPRGRWREFFI